jgi:hypothetical protein
MNTILDPVFWEIISAYDETTNLRKLKRLRPAVYGKKGAENVPKCALSSCIKIILYIQAPLLCAVSQTAKSWSIVNCRGASDNNANRDLSLSSCHEICAFSVTLKIRLELLDLHAGNRIPPSYRYRPILH